MQPVSKGNVLTKDTCFAHQQKGCHQQTGKETRSGQFFFGKHQYFNPQRDPFLSTTPVIDVTLKAHASNNLSSVTFVAGAFVLLTTKQDVRITGKG